VTVLLSLLSAIFFGSGDFACGHATRRNHVVVVLVTSQIAGACAGLLAAPVLGPALPHASDLFWGALAGLSGVVGLGALYSGIATGVVAVVAPLAAIVSALVPAAFGVLHGERLGAAGLVGAALCLLAIVLLTSSKNAERTGRDIAGSVAKGVVSGGLFGLFYILILHSSRESGLWPLVGARAASLSLMGLYLAFSGRGLRMERRDRAVSMAGGVLDIAGNAFFLLAARIGPLMLASVVTSLSPAPTVVLARAVFGQRLGPARIAGLAVAVAGIALLSMR